MIYLASPYSHAKQLVMDTRYEQARQVTEILLKRKLSVFSPIVYGHYMTGLGIDYRSWQVLNDDMLQLASSMFILTIDGWDKSAGVRYEIERAKAWRKPIVHIDLKGEYSDGADY